MTENDDYNEAVRRVANIAQTLVPVLDLTDLRSIRRLPDDIARLVHLEQIDLRGTLITKIEAIKGMTSICVLDLACTNVVDLETVRSLKNLEWLSLAETDVNDIFQLGQLPKLSSLSIRKTQVRDMRPLLSLRGLSLDPDPAIWFHGTPATANDPILAELSLIEDDTRRTIDTLSYLRSLPPYPDPLPSSAQKAQKPPARVTPTGLRRLSLSDARHILETDHPLIRGRCQRVVSEIDDALALQTLRIPNDPDALDAHNQVTQSLELAKALAVGLHEAIPTDFTDQTLTEEEVSRFKQAFDLAIDKLQQASKYIDSTNHSPTYGGVMRMGVAAMIGSVAAIAPGVTLAMSVPAVYAVLYGKAAAIEVFGQIKTPTQPSE